MGRPLKKSFRVAMGAAVAVFLFWAVPIGCNAYATYSDDGIRRITEIQYGRFGYIVLDRERRMDAPEWVKHRAHSGSHLVKRSGEWTYHVGGKDINALWDHLLCLGAFGSTALIPLIVYMSGGFDSFDQEPAEQWVRMRRGGGWVRI